MLLAGVQVRRRPPKLASERTPAFSHKNRFICTYYKIKSGNRLENISTMYPSPNPLYPEFSSTPPKGISLGWPFMASSGSVVVLPSLKNKQNQVCYKFTQLCFFQRSFLSLTDRPPIPRATGLPWSCRAQSCRLLCRWSPCPRRTNPNRYLGRETGAKIRKALMKLISGYFFPTWRRARNRVGSQGRLLGPGGHHERGGVAEGQPDHALPHGHLGVIASDPKVVGALG